MRLRGFYDHSTPINTLAPHITPVTPVSPHTTPLLHLLGTRWAGSSVGGVICEAQYFQNVMRVGFQLRQAMVAAVFSKSLRLSHSGRQGFSTGRITNMMTNDAESLQMVCQQLHGLWSAPLRILVCIFLLYQQLGVASVLGLLMLLLMILAQAMIVNWVQKLVKASLQRSDKRVALMSEAVIVNRVQKLVKASLQRSDKRVALMSEMLAAMDVVKLYTWEGSFQSKVARIRADEMGRNTSWRWVVCGVIEGEMGQMAQYIMAINFLLMSVLPVLVTVVSFGCYSLLGHQLTAAKAFTSISLFAVLHYPLHMFPSLITQVSAQLIAMRVSGSAPPPLHMFPSLITQVSVPPLTSANFCVWVLSCLVPNLITPPEVVNVNVSLTRLQEMLLADETDIDAPAPPIDPAKPAVEVSHASFAWSAAPSANGAPTAAANRAPTAAAANGAAGGGAGGGGEGKEKGGVGGEGKEKDVGGTLTDVTLSVEPGKLVAIVGATGQGKSSLVSALLGEMPMVAGDSPPIIRGLVAYVSWIFNATLRDNILFGLPYDKQRYERAVQVSALERDLELLPGGDLTEIGERGVNVSGGQKQRISIARAVYSDADVFFFDDPLSALDAHVAKQGPQPPAQVLYLSSPLSLPRIDWLVVVERGWIAEQELSLHLHPPQSLFFTPPALPLPSSPHEPSSLLSAVDWVVMVEGGRIAEQGPYAQLKASAPKFQRLLEKAGALEEHGDAEVGGEGAEKAGGSETSAEAAAAAAMSGSSSNSGGGGSGGGSAAAENGFSSSRNQVGEKSGAGKGEKSRAAGGTTLVQVEDKAQGVVSAAVVWRYVRAMGGTGVLAVLISLYVLVEAARVLASVWISVWTGSVSPGGQGSLYFVAVYSLISLGEVLLTFANQYFLVSNGPWAG
ncbi:unnamed protein product [Closterium sp. Naga37s-1]|nr:unnamed protein product [Closterium sp. Naga37s-1]